MVSSCLGASSADKWGGREQVKLIIVLIAISSLCHPRQSSVSV